MVQLTCPEFSSGHTFQIYRSGPGIANGTSSKIGYTGAPGKRGAFVLNIGRLEPVSVRELWKHEERGFSTWLESNLDVLSEAVGFRLADPTRESSAGCFECDMVCEGANGEPVIIENQLEQTDHDHLGKVLTYLANLEAKAAIWISTSPRPEHIRTVQWLNETTPANVAFYLIRLAAYRISGSEAAAPLFTVIVGPSEESKNFGKEKKDLADRHILRLKFWEQLLERAKKKGVLFHAQRSPSKDSWLGAGAGVRSGISYVYLVWKTQETGVELYIDTGHADENKRILDALASHKQEIEASFGSPLSWERLNDKRGSRVRYVLKTGGLMDEDHWPAIQEAMVDSMDRLSRALKPYLSNI